MSLQGVSKESIVSQNDVFLVPLALFYRLTNRCYHSTAREATGTKESLPQTRYGVPGCIFWCGGV